MSKVLDQINEQYAGKLRGDKIDLGIRANMFVATQYKIRYIPTVIYFDADGKLLEQTVGYAPLEQVIANFKKHGIEIN